MGEESPKTASTPTGAVFLSYASQDAEAAQKICDALRAAGIEVWFDKSELRGGDAWDRQIREQIHDCRLFIPVISANSEHRDEGYFRREWSLAADRTRDMAHKRAFLLPVVIDGTSERGASVPEKFHELQWTRLPGGDTPPAFVERIQRLLSPEASPARAVETPVAPSSMVQSSSASGRPTRRFKPALWAISAVLALALAYYVADRFWLSKRTAIAAAGTAPAATGAGEKSIAVLPFVDLSEKHDQEYFADGMAEEILDLLAKIPELKVIGRTSSFQFKGRADDLRKIGQTLGVAYVLEGSVRRALNLLKVTAQLISTQDGAHRWSDTYELRDGDAVQLQEQVAAGIARALELSIADSQSTDAAAIGSDYDLYIRGIHELDSSSYEGCRQAIALFTDVLRRHPQSERALISMARAHECIAWGDYVVPNAGIEQAREYALQALRVNPRSADAHVVLATVFILHDYDWASAQRELDTASELSPANSRALMTAARLHQALGQYDIAIGLLNQAAALDPLDPLIYDILGDTYMRARNFVKAEKMWRRCLQISPDFLGAHFYLSNALLMQHQLNEALEEAKVDLSQEGEPHGLALVYYAMGRSSDADKALRDVVAFESQQKKLVEWPSELARIYAFRGELDSAFAWLDRAYEERESDMYFVKGDPLLDNLVPDPRYKALLRKMNLPE
jgi:TolB-like protein/Flp pilus assembly protein TadD